jgi:hypothetical protein
MLVLDLEATEGSHQEGKSMTRTLWKGIFKLLEEMGELTTVLGKLGVVPEGRHWDERYQEKTLRARLMDEMADVQAALIYFGEANDFTKEETAYVHKRANAKIERYQSWVLTGIEVK